MHDTAEKIANLKAQRSRILEDLAGACPDREWRLDRLNDLEWVNRQLAKLAPAS